MPETENHNMEKQDSFQTIWAKRLFAISLVLLGIVFTLQGLEIIQSPEPERKPIKAKPVRAGRKETVN